MPVLLRRKFGSNVSSIDVEIRGRLTLGRTGSFLGIVPTKRKVRDLQREYLKSAPGGVAGACNLYTLETIATELHAINCRPKKQVAGPIQAVIVQQAVREVESSLQYFRLRKGSRGLPQGTFQKILNVLNVLKEQGVYLATLYEEVQAADEAERGKLNDILMIYETYERLLGDIYIDAAGVMKEVNASWDAETTSHAFRRRFAGCDALFIAGFDRFSDPELTMIHHLSNIDGIGTLISFDYHLENDEIFAHLRDNYEKLLRMGFQKITVEGEDSPTFRDHIARNLFRYHQAPSVIPAGHQVTLLYAEDREREVELIASTIKRLVREEPGRSLSRICVSMHQPQLYSVLFREVFDRYGIPANITDRYHLDQSPLITAFVSLLTVQRNNFRLADMMRALSTSYLEITNGNEAIDAANLHSVAALLKVTSGKNNWFRRIEKRLAAIKLELSTSDGEPEVARLRREERMLTKARRDLEKLASLLARFQERMTTAEFGDRVRSLLDELRIVPRLLSCKESRTYRLEKDTRAYQKFISFFDEFLDLLHLEGGTNTTEHLGFYIDRLRQAISQVRYNVRQKYGHGVYVTSFDETRGLEFDIMIIAGLVDGEFPPLHTPEFFFGTGRRDEQERNHLYEHRYLFYQALTNFKEHVYLTIPLRDGESDLEPSTYLDALLKVASPEVRKLPDATDRITSLYSEDELLRYLGSIIGQASASGSRAEIPDFLSVRDEIRRVFDHMKHAVCVERGRMNGTPIPEFNGTIGGNLTPETRDALERFRRHVFSVTQLESYGKCPFQFFAERVLRLNVASEFNDGLSPTERGRVLHEILFEFYSNRRDLALPPLHSLNDAQYLQAEEELLSIARRKLAAIEIADVFWEVDKELITGNGVRKGMLQEFLTLERERGVETAPAYFEVSFGTPPGLNKNADAILRRPEPVELGRVKLRGKVDRIDMNDKIFTIVDYKSGTTIAKRKDIELGMSLQLPLYLFAVERILAEQSDAVRSGVAGIYYTLRSPVREQLGLGSREYLGKAFNAGSRNHQLADDGAELRSVVDRAVAFVNQYVDDIACGVFPVAPKDPRNVCELCNFETVCRIRLHPGIDSARE